MKRHNCMKCAGHIILALVMLLTVTAAHAVPAKPGLKRQLTLADGTTVSALLVGDEYGHFWLADDGKAYQAIAGTDVFQAVDRQAIVEKARQRRASANATRMRRLPRRTPVGTFGDYTGEKKGLIILVNFQNKAFSSANDIALYRRIANEKGFSEGNFRGSMYDYFYDQSGERLELTFDVVGPVTVDSVASYYGENNRNGDDKHPGEMVIEALKLVDDDVDFTNYDWDGDGEVDQVYIIYAGKGEADGGATTTIWPHAYTLHESRDDMDDGDGPQTLDGVVIDTYACGPEQDGATGSVAGIGTMCHEFSHCLGYPDFYDTDYSGGQGMFKWDLMDSGSYNGDGYLPAGYTGYERWMAGWQEPIELTTTMQVDGMQPLQDGGDFYIIYNKGHRDEYYMLENRQLTGWDEALPGSGLLIIHVDYDADVWAQNKPNDAPTHQRMTWVAADNKYQYEMWQGTKYYTDAGAANDPFPYGKKNAFNKNTTPAAKFYNMNSDGTYFLDSSVENITQHADGTISFTFAEDVSPIIDPDAAAFTKIASIDELQPDKRYIISCIAEKKAAGYVLDGSSTVYLEAVDVAIENNGDVAVSDDVAVFVLEAMTGGNWALKNELTGRYLYASAAKKLGWTDTPSAWTIEDGTDGVTLTYGSYGTILYNVNYPRFTVYTSRASTTMIQAGLCIERYSPTTGIASTAIRQQADGMLYNLNGQRVSKQTRKGIYIVNGRKVVR